MGRIRIIGGSERGRAILVPPGDAVRPTSDRAREALFNMLGQDCHGMRVLDLFAGSGALGLEALSRGAASVVFVERDPAAVRTIERNLAAMRVDGVRASSVRAGDVNAVLAGLSGAFELVCADPPYADAIGHVRSLLPKLMHVLAPMARVALDTPKQAMAEVAGAAQRVGLDVDRQRAYGRSAITILRTPDDALTA